MWTKSWIDGLRGMENTNILSSGSDGQGELFVFSQKLISLG